MDKDLKKLLTEAEKQGFTWKANTKGHIEVYKNGQRITTFAGTPSDRRSMLNALAPMKRAGFRWPPQR